jgi:hypothetical protein
MVMIRTSTHWFGHSDRRRTRRTRTTAHTSRSRSAARAAAASRSVASAGHGRTVRHAAQGEAQRWRERARLSRNEAAALRALLDATDAGRRRCAKTLRKAAGGGPAAVRRELAARAAAEASLRGRVWALEEEEAATAAAWAVASEKGMELQSWLDASELARRGAEALAAELEAACRGAVQVDAAARRAHGWEAARLQEEEAWLRATVNGGSTSRRSHVPSSIGPVVARLARHLDGPWRAAAAPLRRHRCGPPRTRRAQAAQPARRPGRSTAAAPPATRRSLLTAGWRPSGSWTSGLSRDAVLPPPSACRPPAEAGGSPARAVVTRKFGISVGIRKSESALAEADGGGTSRVLRMTLGLLAVRGVTGLLSRAGGGDPLDGAGTVVVDSMWSWTGTGPRPYGPAAIEVCSLSVQMPARQVGLEWVL